MIRLRLTAHSLFWAAVIIAPLPVGFGQTTSAESSRTVTARVCENDGGEIHCSGASRATAPMAQPQPGSARTSAPAAEKSAPNTPPAKAPRQVLSSAVCENDEAGIHCSGSTASTKRPQPRPAALVAPAMGDPTQTTAPAKAHRQVLSSAVCENDEAGIHCSGSAAGTHKPAPVQPATAASAPRSGASRQASVPVCENEGGEIHCPAEAKAGERWPTVLKPSAAVAPPVTLASRSPRTLQAPLCDNDSGEIHCSRESNPAAGEEAGYRQASVPAPPRLPSAAPARAASFSFVSPSTVIASKKAPKTAAPRDVVLAVRINGRPASDFAHLIQLGDNHFYISPELLQDWRLNPPSADAWNVDGRTVYRLDELPGIRAELNNTEQVLSLSVPASGFVGSQLNAARLQPTQAAKPVPGLFLNHQLQYTYSNHQSSEAGLFEAGFFSQLGVLTSRFSDSNFATHYPMRLDTKLKREFPERMASLTLGDSVSSSGVWARQVNYAGVRWASDFSTQPYFSPVVLPSMAGEAAQPSTVDIYVNGLRTYRQQVDSGPFSIQNLPVISGQGQVQMVVTDVLGRQQIVTQSFINAQQLLRSKVNEYTFEAGALRRGFGSVSNDYGTFFFAGSERHGFGNTLTVDGRMEGTTHQQTVGGGLDYGWFPIGVFSGGFALSHSDQGPGGIAYLMLQHSARTLGYSGSVQVASSNFQQLGMIPGERAARLLAQMQISRSLGQRGSVSVGYLRQENRPFINFARPEKQDFSGITSSFSYRLAGRVYATMGVNLSNSFANASSATFTLVVPLGQRSMLLETSNIHQDGTQSSSVQYMKQLPVGNGFGYNLRTDINDRTRVDAQVSAQNNNGRYELETQQQQGVGVSSRFTETGSLVFMHHEIVPARWLNNSFAVVEVPDTPGVRVYTNNQYITSTSYRGLAVIPSLVPYNRNTIRLDDEGVPVNVGMDFTDRSVVPMSRSGVFIKYTATLATGALFQLVTENDEPLPVDSTVTLNGNLTVYAIALRGEVFIPAVSYPAHLHARWGNNQCDAYVEKPPANKPLPRIGPVHCRVRK